MVKKTEVKKQGKLEEGSKVNITSGQHEGKVGEIKHIRAATGEAHVELADSSKVVNVLLGSLVAA